MFAKGFALVSKMFTMMLIGYCFSSGRNNFNHFVKLLLSFIGNFLHFHDNRKQTFDLLYTKFQI